MTSSYFSLKGQFTHYHQTDLCSHLQRALIRRPIQAAPERHTQILVHLQSWCSSRGLGAVLAQWQELKPKRFVDLWVILGELVLKLLGTLSSVCLFVVLHFNHCGSPEAFKSNVIM